MFWLHIFMLLSKIRFNEIIKYYSQSLQECYGQKDIDHGITECKFIEFGYSKNHYMRSHHRDNKHRCLILIGNDRNVIGCNSNNNKNQGDH